jgi:hypothetical protein
VIWAGVAVSCAVGAGPLSGGGPPLIGDVFFLLQPAKPITAKSKTRQVKMRFLELNLFSPQYRIFLTIHIVQARVLCAGTKITSNSSLA